MSKIKLSKFIELLQKCDENSDVEIITKTEGVIDDWSRIDDIVEIKKFHTLNYYKASDRSVKETIVQIKLK